MNQQNIRIAISAGELSGDQHAAKLVESLKLQYPNAEFAGMGGKNLEHAGVQLVINSEKKGAINGFNLFKILSVFPIFFRFCLFLKKWKPDLLVVVDYPDFNLRLARVAKLFNIKTVYFIPPKIWAWRQKRIKFFHRYIDQTLTIFPFETEFFLQNKYPAATFVGHPFNTELQLDQGIHYKDRNGLLRSLALVPSYPTVAVLAGSRKSEILKHLPSIMECLLKAKEKIPELQALFVIAPSQSPKLFSKIENKYDWIKVSQTDSRVVMKNVDAGLLKSGTCNLEAAYLKLPFCCFYQASWFADLIVKKFVKIKEFSLVNIIKSKTIKEFIQADFKPEAIAEELKELIYNQAYRQQLISSFGEIQSALIAKESPKQSAYQRASLEIKSKLDLNASPNKTNLIGRLLANLNSYRKEFGIALVAMVIFGATDGALPFIIKHFLDGVFADKNAGALWILPVILIGLGLIRAVSGFLQEYLMAAIGHNLVRDMRNKMHQQLLRLTPEYFSFNSSGSILARFTSDVLLVREFLTKSSASVVRDSIRIIVLIAAAIYLDPVLAMVAFIALPLCVYPVYHFGRKIRKLSKAGQAEIGNASSLVQESVAGNRVIKLFHQEKFEQNKFETKNQQLTNVFVKSEKYNALSNPVNEIIAVIAVCCVILYGGNSVITGVRSQGEFISFLVAVFLLYDPIKKLSKVYHQLQQGLSGAERIYEILDAESPVKEAESPLSFPNNYQIEFKNVSFSYPKANVPALDQINLSIKAGQKLALVGFSGSGKSTLVDLLPRFIDPEIGSISIGGVNLRDLALSDLRKQIAMVNQTTFLFNDTIFNNIAYGNQEASLEQVREAAKAAYADQFISQFPDGYQTIVGENGATLSGGEKQRIAIARAILKNAPILILDEATAALDNRSENEVQKALEVLQAGRTAIIIAHRLSTVRNADLIAVMEQGRIVEAGTHQELLAKDGTYLKLHSLQFKEDEAPNYV